jgi:hypothetical protein
VFTATSRDAVSGFLPVFGPMPADGGRYDPLRTALDIDPGVPHAAWRTPLVFGARGGYENVVCLDPGLSRRDGTAALRALITEASDGFRTSSNTAMWRWSVNSPPRVLSRRHTCGRTLSIPSCRRTSTVPAARVVRSTLTAPPRRARRAGR